MQTKTCACVRTHVATDTASHKTLAQTHTHAGQREDKQDIDGKGTESPPMSYTLWRH